MGKYLPIYLNFNFFFSGPICKYLTIFWGSSRHPSQWHHQLLMEDNFLHILMHIAYQKVKYGNFFVLGPIYKCFTIIWGRTKHAAQWSPSQLSRVKKRTFFVRFRVKINGLTLVFISGDKWT